MDMFLKMPWARVAHVIFATINVRDLAYTVFPRLPDVDHFLKQ